jgi:chromosome segregation ATPase
MSFPNTEELHTLAEARVAYQSLNVAFQELKNSLSEKDNAFNELTLKCEALASDLKAALALVEESDKNQRELSEKLAATTAEADALKAEQAAQVSQFEALEKRAREQQATIDKLRAEAKSAETQAAHICASVGVEPAHISPGGEPQQLNLLEQMRAIKNPAEQMAFFRKHKAAILRGP